MQRARTFLAAAALLAVAPGFASAQQAIQVAVNKAELLRFDKAPTSVLVVNPAIADIVADGSSHIFVLGKAPGETQLFVLGEGGKTVMQSTVRVVTASTGEVTIYRGGQEGATLSCAPRCVGGGAPGAAAGGPVGGATSPPPVTPAAPIAAAAR
jgi:hypothetical protein